MKAQWAGQSPRDGIKGSAQVRVNAPTFKGEASFPQGPKRVNEQGCGGGGRCIKGSPETLAQSQGTLSSPQLPTRQGQSGHTKVPTLSEAG